MTTTTPSHLAADQADARALLRRPPDGARALPRPPLGGPGEVSAARAAPTRPQAGPAATPGLPRRLRRLEGRDHARRGLGRRPDWPQRHRRPHRRDRPHRGGRGEGDPVAGLFDLASVSDGCASRTWMKGSLWLGLPQLRLRGPSLRALIKAPPRTPWPGIALLQYARALPEPPRGPRPRAPRSRPGLKGPRGRPARPARGPRHRPDRRALRPRHRRLALSSRRSSEPRCWRSSSSRRPDDPRSARRRQPPRAPPRHGPRKHRRD